MEAARFRRLRAIIEYRPRRPNTPSSDKFPLTIAIFHGECGAVTILWVVNLLFWHVFGIVQFETGVNRVHPIIFNVKELEGKHVEIFGGVFVGWVAIEWFDLNPISLN